MSFSDGGSIGANGSTANNQASLTLAVTQQCNVGELVVLVIADDNRLTGADADGGEVSSVTAGTNTFLLAKGWANNNAAAQAGAAVQIWYSVLTQQINNGANITINFTNSTLSDATAVTGRKFTTSGGDISVGVTNQLSNDAADPGSLDATTSNREALRIRGIAAEVGNNTNLTATTNWTAWANGNSATTGTTGEMCARAEHRIFTGTGSASDPTYVSADCASAYVAFYEDFTVSPSLHDDTDSFFVPTVTPGTVDVAPSLYSDSETFHAPTLLSTSDLSPSLFTDTDTFFAPTVDQAAGADNISPSLFEDADSFFSPTITPGAVDIVPSIYSDSDSFFAPTLTITVDFSPSLYSDSESFFSPTISTTADVSPSLFNDTDSFFVPTVTGEGGAQSITPSIYNDTDAFFIPLVGASNSFTPDIVGDNDSFFAPNIFAGSVNISPVLYADSDVLFTPTISHADLTISPSLYDDVDLFFVPIISGGALARQPTSGVGRNDSSFIRGETSTTIRGKPPSKKR